MGPIIIPNRPSFVILTDRADGSAWMLTYNNDSGIERLSITQPPLNYRNEGARIYDANNGPVLDEDGEYSVIVRGGRVGIEYTPFPVSIVGRDDAPTYARKAGNNSRRIVIDPAPLLVTTVHIGMIV